MIGGLILGSFNFIPSPEPKYNSFIIYLIIEYITPLVNSYFNWVVQIIGYNNIMGNGNSLFAEFGLSNTNLNLLTWGFGVIIYVLCVLGVIGLIYFKKRKKIGWTIIVLLTIPLIGFGIGALFLDYLFNRDTINSFND
ncbi:MAG: hypothetical protein EU547_02525 [Promethearchaeota archaeon]|nr:MAG: hypothetical protein EU547_02525 [Candidatus Lokiarchaeota archaeon]